MGEGMSVWKKGVCVGRRECGGEGKCVWGGEVCVGRGSVCGEGSVVGRGRYVGGVKSSDWNQPQTQS